MAKKKQIRNVLCFLVVSAIVMCALPVSVLAVNGSDNTTGVSNPLNELENTFTEKSPSSGDCAPVPDADLPEIYLNDTPECVLSNDSGNDTNIVILTDVSDDTRETVSALGCDVYVKIDDPCCKGYKVYVDGVYQFTEGQDGTPDGYCAFDVSAGTHTIKITKNGRSASKTNYFQCGNTYRWVSMPYCWCEDGDDGNCKYPPTVKFDKSKYYEGDTVHATVSTSLSSVYYKIKDCSGTVRKSGTTSNGKKISYTIPKGASKCCYWQICFYWNEYIPPMALAGAGGEVTAQSYDCTKCYKFYVCPVQTCDVYVKIDDPYCVGYKVYVDGVYQFTEGEGETPDGYCAFYVTAGTHTIEIRKNGCSASITKNFESGITYRWVSMPDYWCNCNKNCPADVKFIGTAKTDELTGWVCYGTYYCDVIVDKIISDPDNSIHVGSEYTVGYGSNPKYIKSGDKIEVDGSYYHSCGPLNQMGRICGDVQKILPDLVIEDITWATGTVCLGETITFTVTIKNIGKSTAESSTVKYYINNQYIDFDNIPSLSLGATSTQKFTWTANKCGNVQVKAVADANNAVSESNEGNNARTETVSITCPTLKPDLIITDISWGPSNPDDGDTIAFTVTIKNQGSGSAGSSTVQYYVDGSYVGYDSVPALSAGSTSTQTFTWTANKCGNVQVKAVADANNAVDEGSNDGNNDRTETINVICREKPTPEIIKVTYPTACVKEDEYTTISVTVKNNGGASSEGYISVSFPNDEHVSGVSGTGNGYNKLYPKGSLIWNSNNQQMGSVDPLVELLETNWQKGQQETITMNVKPNSGSNEIVFYVRAALKNADGTYERNPTYSGDKDQQGWCVERHVIDVCPKEACVVIDDDTCVGYKVYVDDVYQLTEGVGEPLDGYCTFDVIEGVHNIEIRDNGRYTSITRNFEGIYTWNSMPDNWCKGNAAVKFKGVIVKETYPISFYNYKVKIEEILEDPSGVLNPGDEVWVWAHADGPALVDSVSIDEQVEVYGTYDGEPHREVKLETGKHYLKNLEKQEIKFNGTAIGYFERIGAWGWNVSVDEIISGPSELQGHTVSVALWSVNDPPGYMDYNIEPGDKVRIHGMYVGEDAVTLSGSED